MSTESWIALVLLLNLSVYMNLGGTDFGGRYLALTARGPRKADLIKAVDDGIGPLYAVNHLLFMMAAAMLFVAFPVAGAVAAGPLLVPVLLLFGATGIRCLSVLFELRALRDATRFGFWRILFGISGIVGLVMLGVVLGAMSGGDIHIDPARSAVRAGSVYSWLAPFPLSLGGFLLALGVLTANVRLLNTTSDDELKEIVRRRALRSAVTAGALAFFTFLLTEQGAPYLSDGLSERFWSIPFQLITGSVAIAAIFAIWRGNDGLASVLVMSQLTLVILGWGLAQQPYLIYPDLRVTEAVSREPTLRFVLGALIVGTALLFLSFWFPKRRSESTS